MKGCLRPLLYALAFLGSQLYAQEATTTTVIVPSTSKTTIVAPTPVPPTTTTVVTGTPTSTTRIITPTPEVKEVVTAPGGYLNCFTVREGWYQNIWIPDHQVCQYQDAPEGKVWVGGYWGCDDYNLTSGQCIHWSWTPPRWQSKFVVY